MARDLLAREYSISQAARLEIAVDSVVATDSTSLVITAMLRTAADRGVSGLVRTATLQASGGVPTPVPGVQLPIAFSGAPAREGTLQALIPRAVPEDPCLAPAHAVLGSVYDLVFSLPDTLYLGRSWSDSGSVPGCRAGARLVVSTARTYSVRAHDVRDGLGVLLIDRRVTSRILGAASRAGDTTVVEGQGAGTGQFIVDAATGSVLEGSATSTLNVVVRGAVRTQRAQQVLRTRILRIAR